MKKLLLLLTVLGIFLFSMPVMADTTSCVPKKFNGHSYLVINTEKTWADAKDYCESYGGHLLTINSAEEMAYIKTLPNIAGAWIGAQYSSGSWKWVTNESFSYSNWYSTYSSTNYRGCIYSASSDSSNYGKWGTDYYTDTNKFICEWDSEYTSACHAWKKTTTTDAIDSNYHNIQYECTNCQATKIDGSEGHTWGSYVDKYENADEDTHYRYFKCSKCGYSKQEDRVPHIWETSVTSATKKDNSEHTAVYKCKYCDATHNIVESHEWQTYSSDYQSVDDQSHARIYKCRYCDATNAGESEEHDYSSWSSSYTLVDNTYHAPNNTCYDCDHVRIDLGNKLKHYNYNVGDTRVEYDYGDIYHYYSYADKCEKLNSKYHKAYYKCSECYQLYYINEAHNFEEKGSQYVNSTYCRPIYKCNDCAQVNYGGYRKHNYVYYKSIKAATITQKGIVQYRCSYCKKVINKANNWKLGQAGSTSYNITYHTSVYKNTTKLTIKLVNGMKGAVLNVNIAGKKYSKKLTSNSKTVKLTIKKPSSYGKKVSFALCYKGKLIGKDVYGDDDDRVWYAKKVRTGMTKNQVKWTWGSADRTSSYSGGWTYWYYDDDSYVAFKGGKVKYWYNADN